MNIHEAIISGKPCEEFAERYFWHYVSVVLVAFLIVSFFQ
jgi:hypothetical protein